MLDLSPCCCHCRWLSAGGDRDDPRYFRHGLLNEPALAYVDKSLGADDKVAERRLAEHAHRAGAIARERERRAVRCGLASAGCALPS